MNEEAVGEDFKETAQGRSEEDCWKISAYRPRNKPEMSE
jgi:hypothetical protein